MCFNSHIKSFRPELSAFYQLWLSNLNECIKSINRDTHNKIKNTTKRERIHAKFNTKIKDKISIGQSDEEQGHMSR